LKKQLTYLWLIPASIALAGILFSCSNDLEKIKLITESKDIPDEVSTHLRMVVTDSGHVSYILRGGLVETRREPNQLTTIKNGIELSFYNREDNTLEAVLTAKYGERSVEGDKLFVRDSVVLKNLEQNQQLETEELYWRNDSIFSNKSVVVKTSDGVIWGKGIVADQTFNTFTILKPTGEKYLTD
jgi:LPS export ABC transporter protein LptC